MATLSASVAVGEVLRQPDDLVKLASFRNKLLKEKAALDSKLAEGVRSQLDATRDALLRLQESRAAAGMIREEMIEVEKLKRDKAGDGVAFDKITRVSSVHRNFAQTAKMVTQLQSMADKVEHLAALLAHDMQQDGGPVGVCPNLLPIHFQLQQLEAFRNETMHAAKRGDKADGAVLRQWFEPLDRLGHDFEAWLFEIAAHIVDLSRHGYGGTVVRLLKIISFEGHEDEKAVALRLMRKGKKGGAGGGAASNAAARVIKNYRHKLLDTMERAIAGRFEAHYQDHEHDMLAFLETLDFMYKDIIRIQSDLEALFPPDYEIVQWLIKRYHKHLNAVLRRVVEAAPEAQVLLELHAWTKEYRKSMTKDLGIPAEWLTPPLLDGRSQDLIEDYVQLIIAKLDEWTVNLQKEETSKFRNRLAPPNTSPDGLYGMDGVVDFFQLVNQQVDLAMDSKQGAVLARVVTECARVMRRVQAEWIKLLADEAGQLTERRPDEVAGGLVEYTMALANDQLRAADHTEALQARLEPLVSDKYKSVISEQLNGAIDGYLDVAKRCTTTLVEFVFNDLRPATRALITPNWYTDQLMPQIVETMRDYLGDYQDHLTASIFDILVEDLLDAFLIIYLTALRRAPAKSLRMPAAAQRIRDDLSAAFDFFAKYKQPQELENSFEVMDAVVAMISASPDMIFMDYWTFAQRHGPQLQFVEAIIRARDDLDRSTLSDVLDTIKRKVREEGIADPEEPTIMVKVHGKEGGLMANLTKVTNLAGNIATSAGKFANRP